MVWPAIIGAVGAIGGGLLSQAGSHSANRANVKLQREQQAWEKMMSDTAMQRHVADLRAAGLNPMLGMTSGGASTPSVAPARVENENRDLGHSVSSAVAAALTASQIKAANAQAEAATAQARKTNAEAAITEKDVPYSAQNAQMRSENLKSQMEIFAKSVGEKGYEVERKRIEVEELMPLVKEMKEILIKAEKLGLSEKEAISKLYEAASGVKGVERLMPIILSILRSH